MLFLALAIAAIIPGLSSQILDANGVSLDEKVLAIERLMLTPGTIDFQTSPCHFILNGPPFNLSDPDFSGEQTSAHWIRTAFHDFVTANVTAGTGGLDASIGFESGRKENEGSNKFDPTYPNFIDRTIIGFNLFSNVFISTADFIALGVAEALLSCDPASPMMELRAGRIDAISAGRTGVPQPLDPLASQRAAFDLAGFNSTEMIQAVACGHTIGGVHGVTFPEIVGNQLTAGTSETDFFDDTPYTFDNVGLVNYLAGKKKAGGPLVTTDDIAARSDFRIFSSDNNATVRAMAASQLAFEKTCTAIFAKMINTVPRGTMLSAPIGPRKYITMFSTVDFIGNSLTYFGKIGTYGKLSSQPNTVAYAFGTTSASGVQGIGASGDTPANGLAHAPWINNPTDTYLGQVFPFFGNITYYSFNRTISSTTTSLSVQNTYTESVNTKLFVVPSLSFKDPFPGQRILVRAALLTTLAPAGTQLSATLYYPTDGAVIGTTAIVYKQSVAPLTFWKTIGDYSIFSVNINTPEVKPTSGGKRSIDVVKVGTTLKSAKIEVDGLHGNIVQECANSDLATCTHVYSWPY